MSLNTCPLAYQCQLSFNHNVNSYRKTKIVCTVGPACADVEKLKELIKQGMCIARLNFSHGNHEYHENIIKLVREAAAATGEKIAIALDTKGPEIRTGKTKCDETITVKRGQSLIVSTDDKYKEECNSDVLYVDYKTLAQDVKPGQTILVADGTGVLTVESIVNGTDVKCKSHSEASFGSRKNVCLPGVTIRLPALAPKDVKDIKFGMQMGVDIIFASFIRNAENVKELRDLLNSDPNGKNIKIISKIENLEGVTKIDEVIQASDGIMVARGDLGMDLPMEQLPSAQKMIIARCNCAAKPVICATQMMESMIKNERPTRAEVTDVHNAVLDGADAVMLSGETANGSNPPAVVSFMHKITQFAEDSICRLSLHEDLRKCCLKKSFGCSSPSCCESRIYASIGRTASDLALDVCASAIICLTTTGETSRYISSARPHCPILAVCRSEQVCRQAQLYCGVVPVHCTTPAQTDFAKWCGDVHARVQLAVEYGIDKKIITSECPLAVVVAGRKYGPGNTDNARIIKIDVQKKTFVAIGKD